MKRQRLGSRKRLKAHESFYASPFHPPPVHAQRRVTPYILERRIHAIYDILKRNLGDSCAILRKGEEHAEERAINLSLKPLKTRRTNCGFNVCVLGW